MRATYTTKKGSKGIFEAPVILPQPMTTGDGFTLLGFEDWEKVTDEKLSSAITNLEEFEISNNKIGFTDEN